MPTPSHPTLPAPLPTPRRLQLGNGQHLQLWLPAGSQLLCQAPLLRITEAAYWHLDRLVSRQTRLDDGECLVLEREGWVGILAPRGGELLCLAAPHLPWHAPWSRLLRRLGDWRNVLPASRVR
jgi:hypothetical protein